MDRPGSRRLAIQLLHAAGNHCAKVRPSLAQQQHCSRSTVSSLSRRALWLSSRACRHPAQGHSSSSRRPVPPPPPPASTELVAVLPSAAAAPRRRSLHVSPVSETAAKMSRCPVSSAARQPLATSQAQAVDAPLTQSATFLVLSVAPRPEALQTVRATLAGIDGLAKNVTIRDSTSTFSCAVGIGSDIWDQLTGLPRPAELHAFPTVKGAVHTAVSTPGDLLFHIRSDRRDICFEFERQLMKLLGDAVQVQDATVGFRYFDLRDLLGFVDGTANPVGPAVPDSVLIADEDAAAAGEATSSCKKDGDGNEHDILRDNMPFGSPGNGEFGTYFIGYSRRLWVTEKMLERMFVGDPPGLHDRILDYSRPMTGTTFYAPPCRRARRFG
ncbi:hypothetical protein ACCO45_007475 [Purpureocillium lilacinum]|uniref:Uncharacterized protein n=1 Tax=Purpureocillium lilacinum TaxID=33203 RepID=A0ACC4DTG6_PURLI